MTKLGRLIGEEPPKVPGGGRAYVSQDDYAGTVWCVRVQMPGDETTPACKRLGPKFKRQVTAYAYLDWITGVAPTFSYPAGEA